MKNPTIVRSTVMSRAERDSHLRHAALMKQLDRLDVARELRPHRPALVNEVLRRDEAVHWDSPVIQAITRQTEPLTGPRTGTHPMAVPISKAMATRLCPSLHEPKPLPAYRSQLFYGAVNLALIAASVALAWWLA